MTLIFLFLLLLPNPLLAKTFRIESEDLKRIDAALDLVKTWGNLVLPEEFKRVLNTTVTGAETGTDISYGLLVLSSLNEMEMIDMVVSQNYKRLAAPYFNTILDQQISLVGYYKGLGFDIVRILYAKNIGGPISALTLNTFDMTNKVVVALLAIHNLEQLNFYDGLWRYFEQRRSGAIEQEAWETTKYEMGIAYLNPTPEQRAKQEELRLQFADYWNKWGPMTDAFGVKKKYKDQYREEIRSIVQQAAEAYIAANAAQKTEIGFVQAISNRIAEFGQKVKQGFVWVTEKTRTFVGRIGSFISSLTPNKTGAGVSITILDDKTIIEKQPSGKKSTIVENSPDDNPQKQPSKNTGDRNNITAEGILNRVKEEQPEQRNPQILVPRMLAQQREAERKANKNLAKLSFEGCRSGQININAANAVLLNELTGIGPAKAQSIIEFRSQKAFYKVDDLTKISGIGEVTLSKIKDQGLACAAGASDTSFTSFQKTVAAPNSGTSSSAPGGSAGTPTFKKILITEVQTAGTGSQTDEFVELYNPNDSKVELHDWYLQKKTQSATDFSSFVSKTLFEGEQIAAHGYFLIARQGSSFESNADIVTTSSLADNNALALKNPNGEVSDKVGWGSVLDYEGSPASNPTTGKSLSRKYSSNYQDSDNNSQDFEEEDPTPKAVNQGSSGSSSSSGSSTDTTLPEVVFDTLPATQTSALFSLGWTGSGSIDSYYLQHTTSPSTDGVLQYSTAGTWQNWQTGSAGEISFASTVNSVSLTAQDGIEYMFSITARDASGNESDETSLTTNVALEKNVVINEIAWAGTKAESSDEWIELYNNTSASIDLSGWKLQSSDADGPDIGLSGSIGANSFYLIERTDDNPTSETANTKESFGNGLSNDTCEVLYIYDSSNNVIDQTFCNSNGTWPGGEGTPNYISLERIDSQTSGADSANWTANNLITFNGKDFENNWINGTPKAQNSVSRSETEITNLRFDEFSTLTLTLLGQPYYKSSQLTIPSGKTLTIEPGVMVKLKGGAAKLEVSGTLNAVGTSSENIVFTTYEPPGSSNIWCGLHFTSTSQDSNLQYVTIEKAGSTTSGCGSGNPQYSVFVESSIITFKNSTISGGNGYRKLYLKNSNSTIDTLTVSGALNDAGSAAIYIDGGNPTVKNSTLSDNSIGIWNTTSAGAPTISDNTFTNNTYPIKLTGGSATLSGNAASENTYDAILVEGSTSSNITWAKDTIPYLINTFTVNSEKTLTIATGTTIKFVSTSSELIINGGLTIQGTVEQLVTFSPLTSSSWKRIQFGPGSSSILQYTKIENGGNTNFQGALHIKEATVEITNVEIKNSANNAIYGFNATISGSNLTLTDNTYGFLIQTGDCPSIANVTISGGDTLNTSSVSCTF